MIRTPPKSTLFPNTTLSRSPPLLGRKPRQFTPLTRLAPLRQVRRVQPFAPQQCAQCPCLPGGLCTVCLLQNALLVLRREDRKSTRLNSSHANISYAVFCLKK